MARPKDPHRGVLLSPVWELWDLSMVKSAGMPARSVLQLASEDGEDQFLSAAERAAAIDGFVLDPWFQEALAWQNRSIIHNWLGDYAARLQQGPATLNRRGYREGLVARYVQRYSVRNETIGFFGPFTWAWFDSAQMEALKLGPDDGKLRRRVFFAGWAMEKLAHQWEALAEVRRHLPPCRDPSGVLVGTVFMRPRKSSVALSAREAAVLRHCDGSCPIDQLQSRILRTHPELGIRTCAEVESIVTSLHQRGCITWGFRLPVNERMDESLYSQVSRIPQAQAREPLLAQLRELRDQRDRVRSAAADLPRLIAELDELDRCFARMTGVSPRDARGKTRIGRALVWEDTVSSRELTIGPDLFAPVSTALSLVLDCCRWLTWRLAEGIQESARRILRTSQSGRMPFALLLLQLTPELAHPPGKVVRAVMAEFQSKLAAVVGYGTDEPRFACSTEQLAAAWHAAFNAPGPGWTAARLHSPDLMLAATDVAAVNRGEFSWVIGELHVAVNTLENRMYRVFEPSPGWMAAKNEESRPGVRYVPAFPRHWSLAQRTYPPLSMSIPDRYRYWSIEDEDGIDLDIPRIPTADLYVTESEGHLEVVSPSAENLRVPLTEFIGEMLSLIAGNLFKPVPPLPHAPRITLDRLVIHRESWTIPVGELLRDLPSQGGARELVRTLEKHGVVRHSFVKLPEERKPVFCDLRSQLLLNNVARMARRARSPEFEVTFQEMLPDLSQLWFVDREGRGRTAEFRCVAVDQEK